MNVSARRLAVLGCAFALSCDQCETLVLTRGNLDRVADIVVEEDGVFRGRLVDADAGGADADATISFPGAALSVSLSSAGAPVPGSVLAFALDPHVDTMGLNLADDVSFVGDGGVGTAAFVATGIAGGATIIPDPTSDDRSVKVKARRMALSSGSIDGTSGLPLLITCDEAETSLGLVETFR